jgi:hypothetical protein
MRDRCRVWCQGLRSCRCAYADSERAATAGLIRPAGTYTVDPIGESSSRVSSELDLKGHGIGKLFAPLALQQAAKQVPVDLKKFKELLESGVAPAASNRR